MLESMALAAATLFQPTTLAFLLLGCALGFVVGVLPGLGGVTGLALLIPLIYGMEPYAAIAMLIGAHAVTHTSDTFPSVLIGVPGSSGSQATVLDGYPLAQQGQGAKALTAAFISSVFGGVTGGVALFFLIFIGREIVLAIGTPELLMLAVLGLSMTALVSGSAPLAGLVAGALGLLVGGVGLAPATATYRFTFQTVYLMPGISLAIVALGLFAIPELLELLRHDRKIARTSITLPRGQNLAGLKAWFANRWLSLRMALLGSALGTIPGVGGAVVDWVTYGIAAQTSKNPENFGRGDIRGVIAPESANNAKEAGTLVPTLLFGIPGSGSMALLLGGLSIAGFVPGPQMLQANLPVTIMMIGALILANIIACAAAIILSRPIAKLTLVRGSVLVPLILPVIIVAAYQWERHFGDVISLAAFGALGFAMMKCGVPRAPFLIGFVLSDSIERRLMITLNRFGLEFLFRPGVLLITAFTLAVIALSLRRSLRNSRAVEPEPRATG